MKTRIKKEPIYYNHVDEEGSTSYKYNPVYSWRIQEDKGHYLTNVWSKKGRTLQEHLDELEEKYPSKYIYWGIPHYKGAKRKERKLIGLVYYPYELDRIKYYVAANDPCLEEKLTFKYGGKDFNKEERAKPGPYASVLAGTKADIEAESKGYVDIPTISRPLTSKEKDLQAEWLETHSITQCPDYKEVEDSIVSEELPTHCSVSPHITSEGEIEWGAWEWYQAIKDRELELKIELSLDRPDVKKLLAQARQTTKKKRRGGADKETRAKRIYKLERESADADLIIGPNHRLRKLAEDYEILTIW